MRTAFIAFLLTIAFVASFTNAQDPPAQAVSPVDSFIDAQSLIVARIDTGALDLKAAGQWLTQALQADKGDPAQVKAADRRIADGMSALGRWLDDFRHAGGREIFVVVAAGDLAQGGGFVLATLAPGADDTRVGQLLESGPNGPTANQHSYGFPNRSQKMRQAIVCAAPQTLERLEQMKPAPRPELGKALANAGNAPIAVALIPSDEVRRVAEALMPRLPQEMGGLPMTVFTNGVLWASLAMDPGSKASIRLEVKSKDAAAAQNIASLERLGIAAMNASVSGTPAAADYEKASRALEPRVTDDRTLISLNDDQIKQWTHLAGASLLVQRDRATRAMSVSQEKQLLLGCVMYANKQNNGQWPDSLESITEFVGGKEQLARLEINPVRPGDPHGYVYRKPPANPQNSGKLVVLYEKQDQWSGNIVVGFADGHVEMVSDEARFKAMLK